MADEANEFWSAFEKDTGEKVEARSMGELYTTSSRDSGLWGLLVLTDKSFRFKHMPSENWLTALFKKANRSAPQKVHDVAIPRGDILAIITPKSGFVARLFGPAFPHFSIRCKTGDDETSYAFSVDPGSGLLAALVKAAPSAGGKVDGS